MENIADKPRLIWYKNVQNDKIFPKTYTLLRLIPDLGYSFTKLQYKVQLKLLEFEIRK